MVIMMAPEAGKEGAAKDGAARRPPMQRGRGGPGAKRTAARRGPAGKPGQSASAGRRARPDSDKAPVSPARGRGAPQPAHRSPEQRRYDGPELPDDVSIHELDRGVRRQLSSLPERLADRVGRHLAMAGRLLTTDPETAYQHTQAARARAARVAVVREACGEAAYAAGHFAEALTELRAGRRMSGSPAYLPMIADCERAVGRPARALEVAQDPAARQLDRAGEVEMAIVASGARRDLGQQEAALAALEAQELHSRSQAEWVPRLRYAYADALADLGRREEALAWFHRVVAADPHQRTDADERVRELE